MQNGMAEPEGELKSQKSGGLGMERLNDGKVWHCKSNRDEENLRDK